MTKQLDRLKRLAAAVARQAAMPMPEDYRIHRFGKEMRALLKAKFPGTDFFIASSDGFDTMHDEHPPTIEVRWNDEPSRNTLDQTLRGFIEEFIEPDVLIPDLQPRYWLYRDGYGTRVRGARRGDFHFEMLTTHGFRCRTCGRVHDGMISDDPHRCPTCVDP